MPDLLPLFLNVAGRAVLLVGGGRVAEAKLRQLTAAGARVRVVAPAIAPEIRATGVEFAERGFEDDDLDGVWLVVAAATTDVNRAVAAAADQRHIFVNAVDDPSNASAFLTGVVRREGVTLAVSTSGDAPALTSLIREALDALLPRDVGAWLAAAKRQRLEWKEQGVRMEERKPLLLRTLNDLYGSPFDRLRTSGSGGCGEPVEPRAECVPWLGAPEDSWL